MRTILPRAISVRHNSAHYHYTSHMEGNKSGNSKKSYIDGNHSHIRVFIKEKCFKYVSFEFNQISLV